MPRYTRSIRSDFDLKNTMDKLASYEASPYEIIADMPKRFQEEFKRGLDRTLQNNEYDSEQVIKQVAEETIQKLSNRYNWREETEALYYERLEDLDFYL